MGFLISQDKDLSSILNPVWDQLTDSVERHGGRFWFQIN
jgi:hypothetical protein